MSVTLSGEITPSKASPDRAPNPRGNSMLLDAGGVPQAKIQVPGAPRVAPVPDNGVGDIGASVMKIADRFAQAEAKIQTRKDAIALSEAVTKYDGIVHQSMIDANTQGWKGADGQMHPLYEDGVGDQIGNHLRDTQSEILAGFGDNEALKAAFIQRSNEKRMSAGDVLANNIVKAQHAKLTDDTKANVSEIAGQIGNRVYGYDQGVDNLTARLDLVKPAYTTSEFFAAKRAATGDLAMAQADALMRDMKYNDVEAFISRPDVAPYLSPENQRTLRNRISDVRNMVSKDGTVDGMPLALFNLLYNTPEKQKAYLDIRNSKAPPISIDMRSEGAGRGEMAKLDAKLTGDLNAEANNGLDRRAHNDTMKAALESGNFEPGSLASPRMAISQLGTLLGLQPDNPIMKLAGEAKTAELIDSSANAIAASYAKDMSSRLKMSATFIRDSVPSLLKTKEGSLLLIELNNAAISHSVKMAGLAAAYMSEYGSLTPLKDKDGKKIPSFLELRSKMEKDNPVVSPELVARIKEVASVTPKHYSEIMDAALPPGVPKGQGYSFYKQHPVSGLKIYKSEKEGLPIISIRPGVPVVIQ